MVKGKPGTSWFEEAGNQVTRRVQNTEISQAYATLAVAEAIHRLAAAVERQPVTPGMPPGH